MSNLFHDVKQTGNGELVECGKEIREADRQRRDCEEEIYRACLFLLID